MTKRGVYPARRDKAALRQTGLVVTHPGDCDCRKCRRPRKAALRRSTPPTDPMGRPIGGPR